MYLIQMESKKIKNEATTYLFFFISNEPMSLINLTRFDKFLCIVKTQKNLVRPILSDSNWTKLKTSKISF